MAFIGETGSLYTCGYNNYGQLGLGSSGNVMRPTLVESLANRRVVAASCSYYHTAVVCTSLPTNNEFLEDRPADQNRFSINSFSVGRNDSGQLGLGRTSNELIFRPVKQPPLMAGHISRVACGLHHTLFVLSSGQLFSTGFNDNGQLGFSDVRSRLVPENVAALQHQKIVEAACGYYHSLVITAEGTVYAFGRNDKGQLGINSSIHSTSLPQPLREFKVGYHSPSGHQEHLTDISQLEILGPGRVRFRKVACGCYHSILLSSNYEIYTFGRGNHGQLGHGGPEDLRLPTRVEALLSHKIIDIAGGFYHTVVLASGQSLNPSMQSSSMSLTSSLLQNIADPSHYRHMQPLIPHPPGLSRDYARLFRGRSQTGDVKIILKGKTFTAHRCILWARCRYLDELIDKYGELPPGAQESKEKDNGQYNSNIQITIQLDKLFIEHMNEQISCLGLQIFLLYLYSDKVEWNLEAANNDIARSPRRESRESEVVIDLLKLALFFKLTKLKEIAQKRVLQVLDVATVCKALSLVWNNQNQFSDLKEKCLGYAINHFGQLIAEPSFAQLPHHILREILTYASSLGVKVEGKK